MKRLSIAAAIASAAAFSPAWSQSSRQPDQTYQQQTSPSGSAQSATPSPARGATVTVNETETVAEVVKVNPAMKTLTIKDPNNSRGKKVKITVPDDVQSLDQIKPGSLLDIRFVQATALSIDKPGASPSAHEETVRIAPSGGAPGEVVVNQKTLTARIKDVDMAKREITVKGQDGNDMTLHVAEDLPFDQIKVGDTAAIRYSEAIALAVVRHNAGAESPARP